MNDIKGVYMIKILLRVLIVFIWVICFCDIVLYADNGKEKLKSQISYHVLQQDVRSALKDISTQLHIPIHLASSVKGKVAAGEYKGSGEEILDQIVSDLNLQWFFDGNSIYISNIADAKMRIIRLNNFTIKSLKKALENIDLDHTAYPLKHDPYNNMVSVYGPPRYVAMVEVVAHHLTLRGKEKPHVLRGHI